MEARVWELEEGEIEEIEVEDDSLPGTTTTLRKSPAASNEEDQKPLVMPSYAVVGTSPDFESGDSLQMYGSDSVPNIVKIRGSDGTGRPLALFKSSTLRDIGGDLDLVEMLSKRQQLGESWEREFKEYRREQEARNLRERTKKTIRSFISPASKVKLECLSLPFPKKTKLDDGSGEGRSAFSVVSDVSSLKVNISSPEREERAPASVVVAKPAPVEPPTLEELKKLADDLVKIARKKRGLSPDSPRRVPISRSNAVKSPSFPVFITEDTQDEVNTLRDRLLMSLWRDARADGQNVSNGRNNGGDENELVETVGSSPPSDGADDDNKLQVEAVGSSPNLERSSPSDGDDNKLLVQAVGSSANLAIISWDDDDVVLIE